MQSCREYRPHCPVMAATSHRWLFKFTLTNWNYLVVQWLRIRLPMQGTWALSPVWGDPTHHRATVPRATTAGACVPGSLRPTTGATAARSPHTRPERSPRPAPRSERKPTRSHGDPAQK